MTDISAPKDLEITPVPGDAKAIIAKCPKVLSAAVMKCIQAALEKKVEGTGLKVIVVCEPLSIEIGGDSWLDHVLDNLADGDIEDARKLVLDEIDKRNTSGRDPRGLIVLHEMMEENEDEEGWR